MKSTHNAIAKATKLNPLMTEKAAPEKTAPSCEAIGIKAYEIWMLRGQEQGRDQEHCRGRTAVAAGLIGEVGKHPTSNLQHSTSNIECRDRK